MMAKQLYHTQCRYPSCACCLKIVTRLTFSYLCGHLPLLPLANHFFLIMHPCDCERLCLCLTVIVPVTESKWSVTDSDNDCVTESDIVLTVTVILTMTDSDCALVTESDCVCGCDSDHDWQWFWPDFMNMSDHESDHDWQYVVGRFWEDILGYASFQPTALSNKNLTWHALPTCTENMRGRKNVPTEVEHSSFVHPYSTTLCWLRCHLTSLIRSAIQASMYSKMLTRPSCPPHSSHWLRHCRVQHYWLQLSPTLLITAMFLFLYTNIIVILLFPVSFL